MKKISLFLLIALFLSACGSLQKTEENEPPRVISSSGLLPDTRYRAEDWAQYSLGLEVKRQALAKRKNPQRKEQLRKAVTHFMAAEKSGKGLEYVYNQISECYYYLYDFTRSIEYAEQAIEANREFRPSYNRLYRIYMRLRNRKKAAAVLESYLKVNPDALRIRYVLARNYYLRLKNYTRAEEEFKKLIKIASDAQNGAYYIEYGNYYLADMAYRRNMKSRALQYYRKVLEINETNMYAHYRLALLYMSMLHLNEAQSHAGIYLKSFPRNRVMNGVVGRIHYIRQESGALSHLRRARGRNLNGLLARGLLLEIEEKDRLGEKFLRYALKRNPSLFSAYLALAEIEKRKKTEKAGFSEMVTAGVLAFRNGAWSLARRCFFAALRIDGSMVEAVYYMGRTYEEEGNREMALHYYLQVNRKKSGSNLMLHIGYLFGQQKKYDLAFQYFDRVAASEPKNSKAYFYKGLFLMQDSKYPEAEKNFRKAISLDEKRDSYYFYLAVVLEKNKKIDEAIDNLEKALKKNPESARINNFLGYLYADYNRQLERSLHLIRKALSIEPTNGAYLDSLGWVYFRKGKYDLALQKLLEAERRLDETRSADPVVYEHIGDAYYKQSNSEKAVHYWNKSLKLKENERIRKKMKTVKGNR